MVTVIRNFVQRLFDPPQRGSYQKFFEVTTKRVVYRTYRVEARSAGAASQRLADSLSGFELRSEYENSLSGFELRSEHESLPSSEKPVSVKDWPGRCDKCHKIEPCMRAHRWS